MAFSEIRNKTRKETRKHDPVSGFQKLFTDRDTNMHPKIYTGIKYSVSKRYTRKIKFSKRATAVQGKNQAGESVSSTTFPPTEA